MIIQPVDVSAASHLSELHIASFGKGWSALEFTVFFERGNIIAAIAYEDEKPVGFTFAWVVAEECEILALGVLPTTRKKGLGGQLLGYTLKEARANGAREAFLEVRVDNDAALALYKAADFAMIGRRKDYYRKPDGSRKDAVTMQKKLAT